MTDVVVWGRRPPPLGGVTRCVQGLATSLAAQGVDFVVVDWREPAALRTVMSARRAVHVHNVSSVLRLAFVIVARTLSGARSVVYFHSGTLQAQLQSPLRRRLARWGFRLVDDVWVTNEDLARTIADVAGVEATVVSPFSDSALTSRSAGTARERTAVKFVGYRKELYGQDVVRRAWAGPELADWKLTVVAYGDGESCERVRSEAEAAGFEVRLNLTPDEVGRVLSEHAVLLRPTYADGDAMIVREALAAGTRVVASDVVPRPAGVELVGQTPEALIDGILNGGRPSDGTGLGQPIFDQVVAELEKNG